MTLPSDDTRDDAPLDPALERVQARLRRLMLIAGLTLGVGMFAVFAAILYRIVTLDTSDAPRALAPGTAIPTVKRSDLDVPADAVLVSAAADGGQIILTYRHANGETLVILDAGTLVVTNRIAIAADQ